MMFKKKITIFIGAALLLAQGVSLAMSKKALARRAEIKEEVEAYTAKAEALRAKDEADLAEARKHRSEAEARRASQEDITRRAEAEARIARASQEEARSSLRAEEERDIAARIEAETQIQTEIRDIISKISKQTRQAVLTLKRVQYALLKENTNVTAEASPLTGQIEELSDIIKQWLPMRSVTIGENMGHASVENVNAFRTGLQTVNKLLNYFSRLFQKQDNVLNFATRKVTKKEAQKYKPRSAWSKYLSGETHKLQTRFDTILNDPQVGLLNHVVKALDNVRRELYNTTLAINNTVSVLTWSPFVSKRNTARYTFDLPTGEAPRPPTPPRPLRPPSPPRPPRPRPAPRPSAPLQPTRPAPRPSAPLQPTRPAPRPPTPTRRPAPRPPTPTRRPAPRPPAPPAPSRQVKEELIRKIKTLTNWVIAETIIDDLDKLIVRYKGVEKELNAMRSYLSTDEQSLARQAKIEFSQAFAQKAEELLEKQKAEELLEKQKAEELLEKLEPAS